MFSAHRLGCLSPLAMLTALVTGLVILGMGWLQGGRMFSPGALNAEAGARLGGVTSHAELGGRCSACHTAPWEADRMADRCTACHTEVAEQMRTVASLHGSIAHHDPNLSCRHCHPEHRGPEAALTNADLADFPHDALGFSLAAHQTQADGRAFRCQDCHGQGLATFDQATCQDCHRQLAADFLQAHLQAYGASCLACHDGADRFGAAFSHQNFAFPLDGKHLQAGCADCHRDAQRLEDFQRAPANCSACHQADDPHGGRFGTQCETCHTPQGWQPATFDHNLAAFKLEGAHAEVACEQCHAGGQFKGTPQNCYSCHQADDPHGGRFGTQCETCHTPQGWQPATFDHNLAAFKLEGAHAGVACEQCHAGGQFTGTPTQCAACHREPELHAGLFVGQECSACHNVTAWRPAVYTGPHTFPMDHGEGGAASCATCHPTTLAGYTCYGCHEHDPAEIQRKHLEEGIADFQDCIACHPTGKEKEGRNGGDD